MIDPNIIVHCAGPLESAPCGRYVTLARALRSVSQGGWHSINRTGREPMYSCPRCFKFSAQVRLRAAVMHSDKPPSEWSDAERAAAEQILGQKLPPRPERHGIPTPFPAETWET